MLELEVIPEHGLQGEAIEFLLGEMENNYLTINTFDFFINFKAHK